MQLITLAAASAFVASAAANANVFNMMSSFTASKPRVRVINRCPYKVYLWSVLKGMNCPAEEGTILETGDYYQENHRTDSTVGVSIKISKSNQCKGVDITQLEYFINPDPSFAYNFLDVSYVDCGGNECPSRQEGYYLKSGNEDGKFQTAGADKAICPILSCSNMEECNPFSYVLPDDECTKSCDPQANLDFYMCGGEAPGEESTSQPAASSQQSTEEQPEPTSSSPAPASSSSEVEEATSAYEVAAAAVTPAAKVEDKQPNVKTEVKVVYVTQYEYANAKRHEHAHAHAHAHHQKFRA